MEITRPSLRSDGSQSANEGISEYVDHVSSRGELVLHFYFVVMGKTALTLNAPSIRGKGSKNKIPKTKFAIPESRFIA